MSTEIKAGDTIVTVQDTLSLFGHVVPKGTRGFVERSGPPIIGAFNVYARFQGDPIGRQVRPGDVAVVPTTPDPSADDALAASLQRLGKVWGEYRDQQVRGAAKALDVVAVSIQQVVDAANAAHQPAPEPELEWKPGTVAEATVRGAKGIRVIRATNTGGSDPHEMDPTWISADLVDRGQKVNGYDGTYLHHDADVTDVRPLVVIDPAAVDADALVKVAHHDRVLYGDTTPDQMRRAILRILAHMGIEATS